MGVELLVLVSLACLFPAVVQQVVADPDANPNNQDICQSKFRDGNLFIDCSDQSLTELPQSINNQVQILHLSNNNFVSIPQELENFIELEELSLAGNHLSGPLPTFVQNWQQLSVLNLSNNNFDSWANFGLSGRVTRLDLSRNKINNIDESAFSGMQSLSYLDMSENRIYNLPSNLFGQTYELNTLILARNYFNEIPNFRSFSLRTLDLSSCQITTLRSNSLASKTSLWEINLSINGIDTIPDNIASGTLQVLDLSYNVINTISELSFSSLPHLAVLDLRGNDFRDIWPSSHFSSNAFLREVRVKGNRWSCDGFSLNLLLTYEFLTREPAKVADPASLICYSPSNVTQMTWQEAYIRTWHQDSGYGSASITAIMIGVIIGVVLTSLACRGLMSASSPEPERIIIREPAAQNLNPTTVTIETTRRTDRTIMRIPLTEDLPPSYDEALLMPRLNSSFHSLPGLVEEEEAVDRNRNFRRSRSIGDLIDQRPRAGDRVSARSPRTVVDIDE